MTHKYLIHADGRLPNFALMRLATYFRQRGDRVHLIRGAGKRELWMPPGEAFGSSIFHEQSIGLRRRIEREWPEIRWGGTGHDIEQHPSPVGRPYSSLAQIDPSVEWDDVPPDYSDYPWFKWSIGPSQRGCRERCKFCVVGGKEGPPRAVAGLRRIWRGEPHPRFIVLLDNDFFGVPEWRDVLDEAREGGFRISLCQGINLRLINDEQAAALATIEYRGINGGRVLYTAWDNLGDESVFRNGVETLRRAGIPPTRLRVYMLVGFAPGETMERIMYRFNEMVALGCEPYPMVYDRSRRDLLAFQRWALRGLYRSHPFAEYRATDQRGRKAAMARARLPLFEGVA